MLLIASLGVWAAVSPGGEQEIGSYATSLQGRTESQVYNAVIAAGRIDNVVIQPGGAFSFVKAVGPWTADRGYRKAPVSYDGELVRSWGGGVCQVSSTLYNAALLAGLEIVERHRHHWPAKYAPPGRDAAVAYEKIDLRLRNNLPEPVRITADLRGESLVVSILSRYEPGYRVSIETETKSVSRPYEVIQDRADSSSGRWKLINRGQAGLHVVTYRRFVYPDGARTEFLSEDRYPAMNRIYRIAER